MTFEKTMICGLLIAAISCIVTYILIYFGEIKSYINDIRTLKEEHEEEIEEWSKAYKKLEDANDKLIRELEKSRRYIKSAEASSKMWKDSYMKNFIH